MFIDDDMLLSTVSITQLGELKIVTSPIELLGQHAPDHKETMISMGNGVMHERSKKAGVHNVQCAVNLYDIMPCYDSTYIDWVLLPRVLHRNCGAQR